MNFVSEKVAKKMTSHKAVILKLFGSFCLFAGFISLALSAQGAQPPQIITYQGKLLIGGSPASTTQNMYFVLYDAPTGGTPLYTASGTLVVTSSIAVTPVSGLFTVNLGDTGTNALDSKMFQNNSALYIEVRIGSEILTPRKRISSAPYAFNSKYLDGVAPSTNTNTTHIPVSDSSGNFNFNNVTSTAAYVGGILSVVGNSYFGNIASGTWSGTAIGASRGGTGADSSGWTGFAYVSGGAWTSTTSIPAGSLPSNIMLEGENISLLNNDAGYITSTLSYVETDPIWSAVSTSLTVSNFATNTISQWYNNAGYITDGNTNWDNSYGFITSSSADNLTNKTGLISMWTNNVGYITNTLSYVETDPIWMAASSSYSLITHNHYGVYASSTHYHTSTTISDLVVADFATPNISQWTNDSGYVTSSYVPTGMVSGTGSNGQVSFWTGANSVSGSSTFVWNNTNGRLSIGTSTTAYKLWVEAGANDGMVLTRGGVPMAALATGAAANGVLQLYNSSGTLATQLGTGALEMMNFSGVTTTRFSSAGSSYVTGGRFGSGTSSLDAQIVIQPHEFGMANVFKIYDWNGLPILNVLQNGNFGILDDTPAAALTVGSGDLFQVNSSGNIIRINNVAYSWPSFNNSTSSILLNDGSGNLSWATSSQFGGSGTSTSPGGSNMAIQFNDAGAFGGTSTFVWDNSTGRLGIGTSTPQTLFQVAGVATMQNIIPDGPYTGNMSAYNLGASTTRWNSIWTGTTNIGTNTWSLTTGADGRLGIFDQSNGGGNELISFATNGNVGIGTVATSTRFYIDNPQSGLELINYTGLPQNINNIRVTNDKAYYIAWESGLGRYYIGISDVSVQSAPALISTTTPAYPVLASGGEEFAADGNNVYIGVRDDVAGTTSVYIYDVTTPASPSHVGTIGAGTSTIDEMDVRGNNLYIATSDVGGAMLSVYNISVPSSPSFTTSTALMDAARQMSVDDNFAYVGENSQLEIFTLANLANKTNIPSASSRFSDVKRSGDYLFAVEEGYGVRFFNVTNEMTPVELNSGSPFISSYGEVYRFVIDGTIVYSTIRDEGVEAFDITSSTDWSSLAFFAYEYTLPHIDVDADHYIYADAPKYTGILKLNVVTGAKPYAAIFSGGNVGIGTTAPTKALTVVGSIEASRGIYLQSAVPGDTTNALYNDGSTLYWNGAPVVASTLPGGSYGNIQYNDGAGGFAGLGGSLLIGDSMYVGMGNDTNYQWWTGEVAAIGGAANTINSSYSAIIGGMSNTVGLNDGTFNGLRGARSVVIGGSGNIAGNSSTYPFGYADAAVVGGISNQARGERSFIGGGAHNNAMGVNSYAFGYGMTVYGNYSFGINVNSSSLPILSQNNSIALLGGNVGIGNNAPSYQLDVNGDINLNGDLRVSGTAGSMGQILQATGFGMQWVSTNTLGITDTTSTPGGSNMSVQFNSANTFGGTSTFVWNNTNGRLGIGTSTPVTALSIIAPTGNSGMQIANTSGQAVFAAGTHAMDTSAGIMAIYYNNSAYSYLSATSTLTPYALSLASGVFAVEHDGNLNKIRGISYYWPTSAATNSFLYYNNSGVLSWETTSSLGIGGGVTGSGTSTQVAFWSGANSLSSSSSLYWDNTNGRLGINNSAPEFALTLGNDGGIIAAGTAGSGATLASAGAGTRMIWYPRKAAFRAGYVNNTQWDDVNIGAYSFAGGNQVRASGQGSTAFGTASIASGNGSFAAGDFASASGEYAFAGGEGTIASGKSSVALGNFTVASNNYSVALGNYTVANSTGAFSAGNYNTSSANYASTLGSYNTAAGNSSLALGLGNYVNTSGLYGAVAMGSSSYVNAQTAMAFGRNVTTTGNNSIAMGQYLTVSGVGSFGLSVSSTLNPTISNNNVIALMGGNVGIANTGPTVALNVGALTGSAADGGIIARGNLGSGSILDSTNLPAASGAYMIWNPRKGAFRATTESSVTYLRDGYVGISSVAMGNNVIASGTASVAIGALNSATADWSAALGGNSNYASGTYATVIGGLSNIAGGQYSVAGGWISQATGFGSVAIGIGNSATGNRSYAFGSGMTVSGVESFGININSIANQSMSQSHAFVIVGGNVGVGTVAPGYSLTVAGDFAATGTIRVGDTMSAGTYGQVLMSTATSAQWISTSSLGLGNVSGTGLANHVSYWSSATSQTYDSDGKFYWDSTNNRLGIGTTAPTETLAIYNPVGSNSSLSLADGDVAHGVTTLAGTNIWLLANEHSADKGGAQLTGFSDASDNPAFEIKGVNVSDPDNNIPAIIFDGYSANGTGVKAVGATKTVLQIQNNGSALFSLLGNGNVGIGTTSPSYSLTIAGNIAVTGTIRVGNTLDAGIYGQMLMSTATSAQWVSTSSLGFASSSGSNNYIQNQNSADQVANFRIGGIGTMSTTTIGTTTSQFALTIGGDGGIYAFGPGVGDDTVGTSLTESGAGTKMLWYPRKAAFRAGYVNGAQWDDAYIGNYSVAFGSGNIASATYSYVAGVGNIVSGSGSTIAGGNTNWNSGGSAFIGAGFNNDVYQANYAFIGAGVMNTVRGSESFVGAGSLNNAIGIESFVGGGWANSALADNSFVGGGTSNIASGTYSFVGGGIMNRAEGIFSAIAGGNQNQALGNYSFVGGGNLNIASGINSTALGRSMQVSGNYSFGVNVSTTVALLSQDNTIALMGGNVGIGTTTPEFSLAVGGDGGILAVGPGLGDNTEGTILTTSGTGTRMIWYPRKGAFRAGTVTGTHWDDGNIGSFSFASGLNNIASGDLSFVAGGMENTAAGMGAFVTGIGNTVNGSMATAFGGMNTVDGILGIAFGGMNTVSGNASLAMGVYNVASAMGSVTVGAYNTSSASGGIALGAYNSVNATQGTALGYYNEINDVGGIAFGNLNTINGTMSVAIGSNLTINGDQSFGLNIDGATPYIIDQDYVIAFLGGDVGIGTTTPSTKLHIAGTTTAQNIIPDGPYTGNMSAYNLGTSAARWNSIWTGTTNIGTNTWSLTTKDDGRFGIFDQPGGAGSERMTLAMNGNIGVGTTTPSAKIHVVTGPGGLITVGTPSNLQMASSTGGKRYYGTLGGPWTHNARVYAYKDTMSGRVYSSSYATLGSDWTDDGSVSYDLEWTWDPVSGADGYRVLKSDDFNEFVYDYYADVGTNSLSDNGDTPWSWPVVVTPTSAYDYSGAMRLGADSSNYVDFKVGNDSGLGIFNSTGSGIIHMTANGNVGIAKTNPDYTLDVNGTVNIPQTNGTTTGVIYMDGVRFISSPHANTWDEYNVFVGQNSGNVTATGDSNVAIGDRAMMSLSGGRWNTAVGGYAMYSNTTGQFNTAIGNRALVNNTDGGMNTAMGGYALRDNISGEANVAVGYNALSWNLADNNTAVGLEALQQNTTGYQNTAVGGSALSRNVTGYFNTAVGQTSGFYNVAAINTTFIGYAAGFGAGGDYSAGEVTAIGTESLYNIRTGAEDNTALGYRAGYAVTTGANNILLGYQAADNLTVGSNNIVIGYNIDARAVGSANTLNIGNLLFGTGINGTGTTLSTGNIGIGIATPTEKMDIDGSINISAGNYYKYNGANFAMASTTRNNFFSGGAGNLTMTGYLNTAMGEGALASNMSGEGNTANGQTALYANDTGSYNTANGMWALRWNTSGSLNVAEGAYSLYSNISGGNNIGVGFQTLFHNTSGSNNSAIGNSALFDNSTGYSNLAFGFQALQHNTVGSGNTAIGYFAGVGNATNTPTYLDIGSTFIGHMASRDPSVPTSTPLYNATAIGNNAKVGASNSLVLGGTGADAVKVGIGTSTPLFTLTVEGGVYASGTFGAGETLSYGGAGTRMLWYPRKSAFRVGTVGYLQNSDAWDDSRIGAFSFVAGLDSVASNAASVAFGYNNFSTGPASFVGGANSTSSASTSFAYGNGVVASGNRSFAIGNNTLASGSNSFAGGMEGTIASGENSFAFGNSVVTSASNTWAGGMFSTSSGGNSLAFGNGVDVSGINSVGFGMDTKVSGGGSFAFGNQFTTAAGDSSMAGGIRSYAGGLSSFALGTDTTSTGNYSVALGLNIDVSGTNSIGMNVKGGAHYDITKNNTIALMSDYVGIGSSSPNYLLSMEASGGGFYSVADKQWHAGSSRA
ncbi:MAG: hypothetical protein NTW66_00585, partial [Candidatus Magasanikbacteria bacterium]|nr:hypothetical protein [Candidatus Magasanikbacteria bacterium]